MFVTLMLHADPKDHEAAKQSDERAAKVAQENAEWEANADKIHNWLHHFEKLKANPQAYHPDLPTDYQQLLGKDGAPGVVPQLHGSVLCIWFYASCVTHDAQVAYRFSCTT